VLAGGERAQADFDMRLRHGEIDDDLDLRVGEQRLDARRTQPKLGGACLRHGGHRIG
jgi:hypothetical protein